MHSKVAVLVVVSLLSIVKLCSSVTTFGQQSECFRNAFSVCQPQCEGQLPDDKKEAIKKCFEAEKQGPFYAIKTCLAENGLKDDSPCFQIPQGPTKLEGKFEVFNAFLECDKSCHEKQPNCTEGCAKPDYTAKQALKACFRKLMQEKTSMQKCLVDAVTGGDD